jgi:hypothetical protein
MIMKLAGVSTVILETVMVKNLSASLVKEHNDLLLLTFCTKLPALALMRLSTECHKMAVVELTGRKTIYRKLSNFMARFLLARKL